MRFSLLVLLLSSTCLASVQEKCTPQEIVKSVCSFFEANRDQAYIKSSDGGFAPNPYYQANIQQASQDVHQVESAQSQTSEQITIEVDKYLDLVVGLDEILLSTKAKKWSSRARMAMGTSGALAYVLNSKFPNDSVLSQIPLQSNVRFPQDLKDPKSKSVPLDAELIKKISDDLGAEGLEKIRTLIYDYKKQNPKSESDLKVSAEPIETTFIKEQNPHTERARDRQKRLFNQAQQSVIEMIKRGRADKDLTKEQKNLIERVTSIRLNLADVESVAQNALCATGEPNAFYQWDHSVNICPGMLYTSDANLLFAIAHEIGHSVDPCASGCEHLRLNSDRVMGLLTKQQPTETESMALFLAGRLGRDATILAAPSLVNEEVKQSLIRENLVSKVIPANEVIKYPLRTVQQCLERAGIEGYSTRDRQEQRLRTEVSIQTRSKGVPLQNDIDKTRELLAKHPECDITGLHTMSEMGEAMSDVFASYALSQHFKEKPPRSIEDFIAANGLFFYGSCADTAPSLANLGQRHPTHKRRTLDIVLNFPGISSQLGCEVQSTHQCFKSFEGLLKNQSSAKQSGKVQQ